MYPVSDRFHQLATQGVPTRCRIYFIDDTVDCTDDADVVANGTLLVRDLDDTDSGRRISGNGGIVFSDLFNTDNNVQIGCTVSKPISMNLLNVDGALAKFAFGRCKVYLDLYDDANDVWIQCPMGVYIIDAPAKLDSRVVTADGYDQMQKLNEVIDSWWGEIDFSGGITVYQLIEGIAAAAGVSLNASIQSHILNGSKTYYESPFTPTGKTFRDALAYLAGVTGTIAYFDRDGALDMKWFSPVMKDGIRVSINADIPGSGCFGAVIADYTVSSIGSLQIFAVDPALDAFSGYGSNVYGIYNNPFYTGANAAAVESLADQVFARISSLGPYRPVSTKMVWDWSYESGDVLTFIVNDESTALPIMQQKMTWRGGYVFSEIYSSGDANRPAPSEDQRAAYRNEQAISQLESTTEQLRSLIQDLSGNYTLIEQTISSIAQTVSGQGSTIQSILDPTGQIWTAITNNSTNLSSLEAAVNGEISERKSYIRFIPSEPAVVLGVATGNEIKLKLVNNVIYFFNGDDDSTDLSLAYAYFNSEESGADRFIAKESIQIGNDDTVARWQLKQLSNGDLVLDLI